MVGTEDFLNPDGSGLNPVAVQQYQDTYIKEAGDTTGIGFREQERQLGSILNPIEAAVTGREQTWTEITPVTATGFYQNFSQMPENERNGIILGLAAEGYFGVADSTNEMKERMEDPVQIAAALATAVRNAAATVATGVVTDDSMIPGVGENYSMDDFEMLVSDYISPGKKYPPPTMINRILDKTAERMINKRMSPSQQSAFYGGVKAAIDAGEYSSVDYQGLAEQFVETTDPVRARAGEFANAVGVLQGAVNQKRIAGSVMPGVTR